eukprot:CAMPEP_0117683538 /NCGR_PEP_ID=MMETSP0804-20121206/20467_1 /TAXON_ID=1074897 /ORGANISM="Tetraselmis astigmatica, Strain CCMP880" /LENGTH=80 /DNA_ID=CAMNT_0005494165 /DNA_START=33 /DNA_END=271 /DNA_ORIENTATION=-
MNNAVHNNDGCLVGLCYATAALSWSAMQDPQQQLAPPLTYGTTPCREDGMLPLPLGKLQPQPCHVFKTQFLYNFILVTCV